jgi:hypothetical protein
MYLRFLLKVRAPHPPQSRSLRALLLRLLKSAVGEPHVKCTFKIPGTLRQNMYSSSILRGVNIPE